ncbi:MAG TPA: PEP/pyruvate-binding domain-containing protein [Candidatus Sulfotelmatobacter sp.]|nr:PEP/pyruvate-binding domain-containing protein [Candidatus Sulfotelmatobacter sp.]
MAQPIYAIIPGPVPAGATPETVGAKAYNLMRLAALGLSVPPGFVIATDLCAAWLQDPAGAMARLRTLVTPALRQLEAATGLGFGDERRPLLVAVRSGAASSMPGMLETVLNVGLCDQTLRGLLRLTGNPRLAWDSYRRLIAGYAETVLGRTAAPFDAVTRGALADQNVASERALDTGALRAIAREHRKLIERDGGPGFPDDPMDQLIGAIEAVLRSWNSARAVEYRRMNRLDHLAGTAVTVQAMVFGNAGATSGSGVGFTRDPASGDHAIYVDFLPNAQGEDVVAGRHKVLDYGAARQLMPAVFGELQSLCPRLEAEFGDVQDFEFTVQDAKLYLLQTRRAKRSAWAALRIAVDLVAEQLTTPEQALAALAGYDLAAIERLSVRAVDGQTPLASAVAANVGVAIGALAFDPESARAMAERGEPAILARPDIDTADLPGIAASVGVVTARGGRTSHGAVVARQLDKVCLVGCDALAIDATGRACRIGDAHLRQGDVVSLDGNSGAIYRGAVTVVRERPVRELEIIAGWRAGAANPARRSA